MKRIATLLLGLFLCFVCYAQGTTRVTLKNGTVLTGSIVEMNPTSHLILKIAGYDSKIDMKDVATIEEVGAPASPPQAVSQNYPDTYMLAVGPYQIEMVLVPGGTFMMGYDGPGSRNMHSEPVHEVLLSPYYVNRRPISKDVAKYLEDGIEKHGTKEKTYVPSSDQDAKGIAELISQKTHLPVTLITEAQCEYVFSSGNIDNLELKDYDIVYCHDSYAPYRTSPTPQVDPVGVLAGKSLVRRFFYAAGTDIYFRFGPDRLTMANTIRISFPASAIK